MFGDELRRSQESVGGVHQGLAAGHRARPGRQPVRVVGAAQQDLVNSAQIPDRLRLGGQGAVGADQALAVADGLNGGRQFLCRGNPGINGKKGGGGAGGHLGIGRDRIIGHFLVRHLTPVSLFFSLKVALPK